MINRLKFYELQLRDPYPYPCHYPNAYPYPYSYPYTCLLICFAFLCLLGFAAKWRSPP